MATREIKTSLVLDGEKKFSAEIKAAQRNLRALKSEVNAEAKAFEANGQTMEANEARLKSLSAQQKQQQVIVKALEGALEDAAKKYGENSAQTDGYRIKLANARAELTNMVQEQQKIVEANQKAGKSFADLKKDVANDWKQVAGDVGGALKGVAATAAGVFATVAAASTAAGKTVLDWTVDAGHQADDLLTESAVTGIDPVTLQQWKYASNFIDVQVDTITGSIKKLRKNMASDTEGVKDAFSFFGVKLTNEAGDYRNAADVFWDIVDSAGNFSGKINDETKLDNMLQTLMGTGYDNLMPLIMSGRNAWEQLGVEAENNDITMDEATLAAFGQFDDTLNRINANYQAIKNSVAEYFLPGTKEAADAMDNLTATFNKFLHGDASTEDVAKAAEETVNAVIRALEQGIAVANEVIEGLQASDDPNVRAIGNLLAGIRDAGVSLWDNKGHIIDAVEGIIGVWVGAKIASAISNLMTFGSHVGNLLRSMGEVIASANAYSTAVETVATAGAGVAGVPTPAAAVALPATAAGATAIWAKMQEEKAAKELQQAIYNATEGTEAEKNQAAWNAYYDVKEPGATGAMEIAKWITGVTKRRKEHALDDETLQSVAGNIIGAGGIYDQDADVVKAMAEAAQAADQHYEAADKSADKVEDKVYHIGSTVDSTMADLSEWVRLNNQRRMMDRTGTGTDDEYDAVMAAIEAIDAKYGGDILTGSEPGKQYLGILQSMSAGALDDLPTVDAVFNLKPAEGTEDDIQAYVDGLNFHANLYLEPVAGSYNANDFAPVFGAVAGVNSMMSAAPVGNAEVTINLDGKTMGKALAPIINGNLARSVTR